MTITAVTPRLSYPCNGSTVDFVYTWPIFDDSDLVVIKTDSAGSETVLTLTTDYTVTSSSTGGTVTTVATLSSEYTLIVMRAMPFTQDTDYISNDSFRADTHEDALDKLTMIQQDQGEAINRSVHVKRSSDLYGTDLELTPVAFRTIGWDAAGSALTTYSPTVAFSASFLSITNEYAGDLAAAVADIGAGNKTLVIDQTCTMTADVTFPSNVVLFFVDGAMLDTTGGHTATVYSPENILASHHQQIVTGNGYLRFTAAGDIWVAWWGAAGDYNTALDTGTDDYDAIDAAFDCARETWDTTTLIGATVNFEAGKNYLCESTLFAGINAAHTKKVWRIDGHGASITGKHTSIILDYTGAHIKRIKDLTIYGHATTTPTMGLGLARNPTWDPVNEIFTGGGGLTKTPGLEIKGSYTVAGLVAYCSESNDLSTLLVQVDAGVIAAVFTDSGYYKTLAGVWTKLDFPNVDTWYDADTTSVDNYMVGARFLHMAEAPSGSPAVLQIIGQQNFTMIRGMIHDEADDMPLVQLLQDPTTRGVYAPSFNTHIKINDSTFHATHTVGVQIDGTVNGISLRGNDWSTSTTADIVVATGVNVYDADIEANTIDGSAANVDFIGNNYIRAETSLNVSGRLQGVIQIPNTCTFNAGSATLNETCQLIVDDWGTTTSFVPELRTYAAVASSGTGEDNLHTFTIPASLIRPYSDFRIIGFGDITNANGNKTIKVKFTDAADTPVTETLTVVPATNLANGTDWRFEILIMQLATTQHMTAICTAGTAVTATVVVQNKTLDVTTDIVVQVTGECAHASDIITQRGMRGETL